MGRRSLQRCARAVGFAGLWVSNACTVDVKLVTPNMDALVRAYEDPRGELDVLLAGELFESVIDRVDTLSSLAGQDFVIDSITAAISGLRDAGIDPDLDVDGHLNLRVICPGEQSEAAPDAKRNGTLTLQVPVDDAALGPVAFGTAKRCHFSQVPQVGWLSGELPETWHGVLDGELSIHLGGPIGLDSTTLPRPLVQVDGELQLDGAPVIRDFDFRIPSVDRFETRLELERGEVILFVENDGFGLREKRGEWRCSRDADPPCWSEVVSSVEAALR